MKLPPAVRCWRGLAWIGLCTLARSWAVLGHAQQVEVSEKGVEPVVVESASISTEVTHRLAVTTFELTFRNPNDQILEEPTFLFPLLEGQRVVGFALELDGGLREAVPVDRSLGRAAFDEAEHPRSDPGRSEPTIGKFFRVPLSRIPARATRRVRLALQENLTVSNDQTTYRLSLDFPRVLRHFQLSLNVHTGSSLPAQARTTLELQLPPWSNGQSMEMEREDFDARGVFEIVLPRAERPRLLTGRYQGKEYFYGEVPCTPLLLTRPVPAVIGLLWDSSASGRERNHEREYALLDAWFSDLKDCEVRLIRLRDQTTKEATFFVSKGDWHALQKELESTIYDGATSLDGLVDDPKVDTWVLVSDGLFNYGALDPSPPLPVHGIVHTVFSSTQGNPLWLRAAAAKRGGEYVNLAETEASQAAFALESQSARVLALEFDPEEVTEVFPEPGTPITGETFPVTGILRKKQAKVRLLIGQNRENAQPFELTVISGDDPSDLAPRLWASSKIEELSVNARAHREDLHKIGRTFGIATTDTSLHVLETVSDYLRYQIPPPEELREEWTARQPVFSTQAQSAAEHLESVVRAFEQRLAGWNQSYSGDLPRAAKKSLSPTETDHPIPPPPPAPPDDEEEVDQAPRPGSEARRGTPPALGLSFPAERRGNLARTEGGASDPAEAGSSPESALQKWSPQSGYMDHLRRSRSEQRYAAYLEDRAEHAREPGFYLDCADFFFEKSTPATALRILSNLAELEVDDPTLLRVLGDRLLQANRADLAAPIFQRVLLLSPDEPQSWRDLASADAALGRDQAAVDLLSEIVVRTWDTRFPDIELIALEELNALAATCHQKLDLSRVDPRLRKNLPLDLRIVLSWDASDCDIDLWVSDPNGQTAKYDAPLTDQGGQMSRDFTGGYGPEEFTLRAAKPGTYGVKINYFGDRRQTALGPVTAQVRVITDFGTSRQQEKRLIVQLKDSQKTLQVGAVEIAAQPRK